MSVRVLSARSAKLIVAGGMLCTCLGIDPLFFLSGSSSGQTPFVELRAGRAAGKGLKGCKGCGGCNGCGSASKSSSSASRFTRRVRPSRTARSRFGQPVRVRPPGKRAHLYVRSLRQKGDDALTPAITHLDEPVGNLRVAAILPRSDSAWRRVYGGGVPFPRRATERTARVLKEMEVHGKWTASVGEHRLRDLELAMKEVGEGGTTVIAGHSVEEGSTRMLVLADGSRVPFEQVHRLAARHNRRALILSCRSGDFGLQTAISWREVESGLAKAVGALRSGKTLTADDLVQTVVSGVDRSRRNRFLVSVVVPAAVGSGAIVVEYSPTD